LAGAGLTPPSGNRTSQGVNHTAAGDQNAQLQTYRRGGPRDRPHGVHAKPGGASVGRLTANGGPGPANTTKKPARPGTRRRPWAWGRAGRTN